MKKILLTIPALMMYVATSFAQASAADFVQAADNSGFDYKCDLGIAQTSFAWGFYGPACVGGDNGGGGVNEEAVNELKFGWGQNGKGLMYIIMTLTTPLDLSNVANQMLHVDLRSTDAITYNIVLEDASSSRLISGIPVNVATSSQKFNVDLSKNILAGKSLASVKKIIFIYDGCPSGTAYAASSLYVSDFKVGGVVSGLEDELISSISSTNLFPNPAESTVNVSMELKKTADVKIELMNTAGTVVKQIAEQTTNNLNKTFSVSDLNAGVYFVRYQLDGVSVKMEKLIVQ